MNFLKVFYNSFFRTLGRIIVYILLGFVFSTILSKIDVHADSLPMKVSLNGDYSKQTWFPNGRNITLSIYSNYSENQKLYDMSQAPQYGYVMICSDAKITSSYSSNPNNITNISFDNTNIPCNRGTMHGTIQYVLFNTPEWACSVQGQSCVFDYSLVFYQESTSNYYIMDSQFVDTQIYVDLSSGYLINQNNQIINGQNNIINNQNNNTDKVIDNQNNNTDKVIDNQNNNTDKVIDNQNNNTDKQIDSQKVCNFYDKNSISLDNYILSTSGVETSFTGWGVTDFLPIFKSSDIILLKKISQNFNATACFYNINKSPISCVYQNDLIQNQKLSVPKNSSYIRFTINKSLNEPQWNICQNGNQAISGGLNDINGSINNDNVDDPSSSINSFKDKIATNGVITQLIGLPVTLFTKVLNSVNGTCSTYNLGSLFGTDLILPCVNIQNYLGTTLWSVIDVLISGLFVYSISRKFIKVFESMSSMNEGDVIGD